MGQQAHRLPPFLPSLPSLARRGPLSYHPQVGPAGYRRYIDVAAGGSSYTDRDPPVSMSRMETSAVAHAALDTPLHKARTLLRALPPSRIHVAASSRRAKFPDAPTCSGFRKNRCRLTCPQSFTSPTAQCQRHSGSGLLQLVLRILNVSAEEDCGRNGHLKGQGAHPHTAFDGPRGHHLPPRHLVSFDCLLGRATSTSSYSVLCPEHPDPSPLSTTPRRPAGGAGGARVGADGELDTCSAREGCTSGQGKAAEVCLSAMCSWRQRDGLPPPARRIDDYKVMLPWKTMRARILMRRPLHNGVRGSSALAAVHLPLERPYILHLPGTRHGSDAPHAPPMHPMPGTDRSVCREEERVPDHGWHPSLRAAKRCIFLPDTSLLRACTIIRLYRRQSHPDSYEVTGILVSHLILFRRGRHVHPTQARYSHTLGRLQSLPTTKMTASHAYYMCCSPASLASGRMRLTTADENGAVTRVRRRACAS
ncbi:hypothetical protein DFH09DRAFT_1069140 [Mycena vulgaris]|nr:hypothetical protein DFH09DRAFT_1069140 [Mycena vulgaris]